MSLGLHCGSSAFVMNTAGLGLGCSGAFRARTRRACALTASVLRAADYAGCYALPDDKTSPVYARKVLEVAGEAKKIEVWSYSDCRRAAIEKGGCPSFAGEPSVRGTPLT